MALDFTFLTAEQIWGDDKGNGQLDVMKRYGTAAAPTDLTLLLGGYMTGGDDRTSENDLTCDSWSASSDEDYDVLCIDDEGNPTGCFTNMRDVSARPVLPPSETVKLTPTNHKTGVNGVEIVEYGEYPQTVADRHTSEKLERLHESKSLHQTGKNYTFDSVDLDDNHTAFKAISYPEYELDGKRYIRVLGRPTYKDSKLSTGEPLETEKPYWVEIQPIEWLVDPTGVWVSKKALFAGIQFGTKVIYDGDFSKTFMKHYLDTYFAKEMWNEDTIARKKVLTGLSAQLEGATNEEAVEAIKKWLKAAEKGKKTQTSPDRLDEAARMQRLMNARNILINAAQQAYDAGDKALLDGIVDLSQHYEVLYNARRQRVASLQARRRAQRKQGDRG